MPQLACIILLSLAVAALSNSEAFLGRKTLSTFSQKVDHFNPIDNRVYPQRYYTWDSSGLSLASPNFLFIGGEAAIEFFEFQEYSAIQWAKELGARYLALEHRFYGSLSPLLSQFLGHLAWIMLKVSHRHSNPFPSLTTENLRYLSSSLADVANFIMTMNKNFTGPWIVFGCSYSGALSAWFRSKYPSLAVAAISPSGPVFAEANFTQFNNNFGNVAPKHCVDVTKLASKSIFVFSQTESGLRVLSQIFNSCTPLRPQDVTFFLWTIYDWMATNAQWENPPGFQLTQACNNLTANTNSSNPYAAVLNWAAAFVAQSQTCNNFTLEAYAAMMRDTSLGNDDRTWTFQQCTEFGFFDGANYDETSIFKGIIPIEFLEQICSLAFGQNLRPNLDMTNGYYGGYNVSGTNIFFTNGAFDPWHTLSVTKTNVPGQFSSVYSAAHCAPMTKPTPQDPKDLTQTRADMKRFLVSNLNQHKN